MGYYRGKKIIDRNVKELKIGWDINVFNLKKVLQFQGKKNGLQKQNFSQGFLLGKIGDFGKVIFFVYIVTFIIYYKRF